MGDVALLKAHFHIATVSLPFLIHNLLARVSKATKRTVTSFEIMHTDWRQSPDFFPPPNFMFALPISQILSCIYFFEPYAQFSKLK